MSTLDLPNFDPIDVSGLAAMGDEEARERSNVANARWLIDHDGKVLPVTTLFDREGESTDSPVLARKIVAFDADVPKGNWLVIGGINPGDIWRRTDVEVPHYSRAERS